MVTYEEAQSALSQQQAATAEAEAKLRAQQLALPQTTARSLRGMGGETAGLKGMQERQATTATSRQIQTGLAGIEAYKQELGKYAVELSASAPPTPPERTPQESFDIASRMYYQGSNITPAQVPPDIGYYLTAFYRSEAQAKEALRQAYAETQVAIPSVKLPPLDLQNVLGGGASVSSTVTTQLSSAGFGPTGSVSNILTGSALDSAYAQYYQNRLSENKAPVSKEIFAQHPDLGSKEFIIGTDIPVSSAVEWSITHPGGIGTPTVTPTVTPTTKLDIGPLWEGKSIPAGSAQIYDKNFQVVDVRSIKDITTQFPGQTFKGKEIPLGASPIYDAAGQIVDIKWSSLEAEFESAGFEKRYQKYYQQELSQNRVPVSMKDFTAEIEQKSFESLSFGERFTAKGLIPALAKPVEFITSNIGKYVGDVPVGYIVPPVGLVFTLFGKTTPTVGEVTAKAYEGLKWVGGTSAEGWTWFGEQVGLPSTVTVPEYKFPSYQGVQRVPSIPEHKESTLFGFVPTITKMAPELTGWLVAPTAMAGTGLIKGSEQLKNIDKIVAKEVDKQYKLYYQESLSKNITPINKEDFERDYTEPIKQQIKSGILLESGLDIAYLSLVPVMEGIKYAIKPLVSKPQTFKPLLGLREKTIMTPKGAAHSFDLLQYRRPPEVMVTTRLRKFLGMKPKFDWTPIANPQINFIRPFRYGKPYRETWILGSSGYYAETGKLSKVPFGLKDMKDVWAHYGTFGTATKTPPVKVWPIEGITTRIQPADILNMPKPYKYLWTGAGKGFKAGAEDILLQTDVVARRWPPGLYPKETRRFAVASEIFKPTSKISFGDTSVTMYPTLTRFKDITFPMFRAAGKIPETSGKLLAVSTPKVLFDIDVYQISKGIKSFKFFLPGVAASEIGGAAGGVGDVGSLVKTVTTPGGAGLTVIQATRGTNVFGPLVGQPYFPVVAKSVIPSLSTAAMFEPTISTARIAALTLDTSTLVKPVLTTQSVLTIQTVKPVLDTATKNILISKSTILEKQAVVQDIIPVEKVITEVIPIQKVTQLEKMSSKQVTANMLLTTQAEVGKKKGPPGEGEILLPGKVAGKMERLKGIKKGAQVVFVPYVKRKGKYGPVAPPTLYFEKAFGAGLRTVKETLAASLQVKKYKKGEAITYKTGKAVPLYTGMPGFRPGKKGKDIFTLVQKAPARLGTRGERIEIVSSRRIGRIKFL